MAQACHSKSFSGGYPRLIPKQIYITLKNNVIIPIIMIISNESAYSGFVMRVWGGRFVFVFYNKYNNISRNAISPDFRTYERQCNIQKGLGIFWQEMGSFILQYTIKYYRLTQIGQNSIQFSRADIKMLERLANIFLILYFFFVDAHRQMTTFLVSGLLEDLKNWLISGQTP